MRVLLGGPLGDPLGDPMGNPLVNVGPSSVDSETVLGGSWIDRGFSWRWYWRDLRLQRVLTNQKQNIRDEPLKVGAILEGFWSDSRSIRAVFPTPKSYPESLLPLNSPPRKIQIHKKTEKLTLVLLPPSN